MKYNKVGSSELSVSEICLGTMTWGEQNSETEAHQQLDYAMDQLKEDIDVEGVTLPEGALAEIDAIHLRYPNPAI